MIKKSSPGHAARLNQEESIARQGDRSRFAAGSKAPGGPDRSVVAVRRFGYNLRTMNALIQDETQRMLRLLESSIRQSSLSMRELERRLGLSQGYLQGLFKGRIQLKVSHVYAIARALGIEPLLLFLQVSPPEDPEWFLQQLRSGKGVSLSFLTTEHGLPNRKEIEEIVRTTIRTELERMNGRAPVG